jgi:hypothetical protein
MWLFSLIAAGGAFQALTLWRLWVLEHKIGNGSPGLFIQRTELDLMRENAEQVHQDIRRRLDALERSSG